MEQEAAAPAAPIVAQENIMKELELIQPKSGECVLYWGSGSPQGKN